MIVRFWGVRGSIPTPEVCNQKYGGNTSCVEVRTSQGQLLVLDAGTGIRGLGRRLAAMTPPDGHRIMLFLTHYHWDHIQGFPFFEPVYAAGNNIYIHGFASSDASVDRVLGEQMAHPFFPVDMSVMRANIGYYTIGEGTLDIGGAIIKTLYLNHPQGALGYRIQDGSRVFVYATDHEHGVEKHDRNLLELAEGADVLVYDAQYTPEEYRSKQGWGHSTWADGIRVAREAGVKHLVLFHHEPTRNDYALDAILIKARHQFPNIHAAAEGMEIDFSEFLPNFAFASGLDKRVGVRQDVSLPVTVKLPSGQEADVQLVTENVSFGGAYVVLDHPVEAGARLEVSIRLSPDDSDSAVFRTTAQVVRCDNLGGRAGVALSFK